MKPAPFEYEAVSSRAEAIALLAEVGEDAKILAGGQSLIPLMNLRLVRPSVLIDVNGAADLAYLRVEDAALEIGAMVRHAELARSADVRRAAPLLADAAACIGHAAIRNRGTIGGSVAHADPAAELPAVLVALGATVIAAGKEGERAIAAADLFEGFLMTTLAADEVLSAVRIPTSTSSTGSAFLEFSRRRGDFALVAAATVLELGPTGAIADARLTFSGVGGVPVRARGAEGVLIGQTPSAGLWREAAAVAATGLNPSADIHGTAAYRRKLAETLAERGLVHAYERAKGGPP
jgi:carbon-monoxide dehydrogenase medium subunit